MPTRVTLKIPINTAPNTLRSLRTAMIRNAIAASRASGLIPNSPNETKVAGVFDDNTCCFQTNQARE